MTRNEAIQKLVEWDRKGRCVFATQDLARLFPDDSPGALNKGLDRLVEAGILRRACRGVYVNPNAVSRARFLEHLARSTDQLLQRTLCLHEV